MNNDTNNVITITLSDSQVTRLLDIQEFDKTKWQETCDHAFELGLSARENSIKATRKRKAADELASNVQKFNDFMKLSPETAKDPAKLLKVMQSFGLAINSLASEVAANAQAKNEKTA